MPKIAAPSIAHCPGCASRLIGRLAPTRWYCQDCAVEIDLAPDGSTTLWKPTPDGDLRLVRRSWTRRLPPDG